MMNPFRWAFTDLKNCCNDEPELYIRPPYLKDPWIIGIKCRHCGMQIQESSEEDIQVVVDDPILMEITEFMMKK